MFTRRGTRTLEHSRFTCEVHDGQLPGAFDLTDVTCKLDALGRERDQLGVETLDAFAQLVERWFAHCLMRLELLEGLRARVTHVQRLARRRAKLARVPGVR